jgi:hypothetical protein
MRVRAHKEKLDILVQVNTARVHKEKLDILVQVNTAADIRTTLKWSFYMKYSFEKQE